MTVSIPSFELPPWAVVTALIALAVPLYLCVAIWAARFADWVLRKVDSDEPHGVHAVIGLLWPIAIPFMLFVVVVYQTILWLFTFIRNRS